MTAQFIVAGHIHHTDEALFHEQCFYCQTAAELSGMDMPSAVVLKTPECPETPLKLFKADIVPDQTSFFGYSSRAPPVA
ncbi:MAG: hypothetical protein IJ752_08310 [Alphaproteobacteria bacterium]|nr:hypothetical protein [Alphaproteobacteria bacterium]